MMRFIRLSLACATAVLAAWSCGSDTPDDSTSSTTASSASSASSGGGGETPAGSGGAGGGGTAGGGTAGAGGDGGAESGSGGAGGSPPMPMDHGVLSGMCGELDPPELASMSPSFKLNNEIDFGMMAMAEPDRLTLEMGAKKVYDDGNLGGSSLWSEVFSYEVLRRCEMASLLKTEGEIIYLDPMGKKTDLLVMIDGAKIGVSVTRAFHFPPQDPYTVAQAQALLEDKLNDIQLSSANADPADAWQKQILHVLAYEPQYVTSLDTAWDMIDPAIKADTIAIVTLTSGDDEFIY